MEDVRSRGAAEAMAWLRSQRLETQRRELEVSLDGAVAQADACAACPNPATDADRGREGPDLGGLMEFAGGAHRERVRSAESRRLGESSEARERRLARLEAKRRAAGAKARVIRTPEERVAIRNAWRAKHRERVRAYARKYAEKRRRARGAVVRRKLPLGEAEKKELKQQQKNAQKRRQRAKIRKDPTRHQTYLLKQKLVRDRWLDSLTEEEREALRGRHREYSRKRYAERKAA